MPVINIPEANLQASANSFSQMKPWEAAARFQFVGWPSFPDSITAPDHAIAVLERMTPYARRAIIERMHTPSAARMFSADTAWAAKTIVQISMTTARDILIGQAPLGLFANLITCAEETYEMPAGIAAEIFHQIPNNTLDALLNSDVWAWRYPVVGTPALGAIFNCMNFEVLETFLLSAPGRLEKFRYAAFSMNQDRRNHLYAYVPEHLRSARYSVLQNGRHNTALQARALATQVKAEAEAVGAIAGIQAAEEAIRAAESARLDAFADRVLIFAAGIQKSADLVRNARVAIQTASSPSPEQRRDAYFATTEPECPICLVDYNSTTNMRTRLLPCRHLLCHLCAPTVRACPVCRGGISGQERVR